VGRNATSRTIAAPAPAPVDVQQLLRGLAAGASPAVLIHEALRGAVRAAGAVDGVLMGVDDGSVSPLSATAAASPVLHETAAMAATTGRTARRAEIGTARSVLAVPLRAGGRIVGAIAVSGDMSSLDPATLSLFADVTSLVVIGLPRTSPLATELLDAVAGASAERTSTGVIERLLDVSGELLGASASCCVTSEPGFGGAVRLRVVASRHIGAAELQSAVADDSFRELLTPGLTIAAVGSRIGPLLDAGSRAVVSVPLRHHAGDSGHLVLLLPYPPDADQQALLASFAGAVGATLLGPDLRRRLRHRDDVLTGVLGAVSAPVLVVGADGCFLAVSPAAGELFGLSNLFEIGQPAGGRIPHPLVDDLLTGTREGEVPLSLVDPSGTEHVYVARSRAVVADDGERIARVVVLEDTTRQTEAERTKSDLLAVVGHELRTPLTTLRASVHHLARRGSGIEPAAYDRTVDVLGRSVGRLERLVEDLLFVSSVEDGRTSLHLEVADLGALVDAFADDRVRVVRPPGELLLSHDPARLAQAIGHLVDNACKFSDDVVELEVIARADEVEIAVLDLGPGIWSGDVPSLFQRFRQLDGSATRAHGGTGLGLYITRRVVEAHDGRIWCTTRLGIGSRFAFTLPR
jgi:signal transduction histidine kinase